MAGKKATEGQGEFVGMFVNHLPKSLKSRIILSKSIMKEVPESGKQEREEIVFLVLLRQALDEKNIELLRSVLEGIQRAVEGTGLHASLMPEYALKELIQTGKGMISVGSGTNGQRIFIENGKLWMPTGFETSEAHGRKYHNNFRAIFHLDQNDEEVSVDF
ncbi:MAG: hypothetical protein A3B13_01420 [Candidatus Liptonbacteria bacterium RIFCSPLOWO2_01_FULL_45_15]|uniref:Uncharacterized protein n=1 Tax=Candidatus Liptonbacteria bacterium RIFCSPLOWO2_01_FULL_45_15 TaxID=1798649 RepID=A0A1G2CE92_9BACT|nr:MAG: hypothetical protein A3B13_01420 [Candidatus Liptonbacteria bacterium RIFCSPLOWO2_01_FULL_45_15]